jgi:hypothetical protein
MSRRLDRAHDSAAEATRVARQAEGRRDEGAAAGALLLLLLLAWRHFRTSGED